MSTIRIIALSLMIIVLVVSAGAELGRAEEAPRAGDLHQRVEIHDPFEGYNRLMFGFNSWLNDFVHVSSLKVQARDMTRTEVGRAVANVMANLREPLTATSSLLIGDWEELGVALERFAINSTLGLAGLEDEAGKRGLKRRARDMRTVFCRYELPPGPFVVSPLFGGYPMRDIAAVSGSLFLSRLLVDDLLAYYLVADLEVRALSELAADGLDAPLAMHLRDGVVDDYATYRAAAYALSARRC